MQPEECVGLCYKNRQFNKYWKQVNKVFYHMFIILREVKTVSIINQIEIPIWS